MPDWIVHLGVAWIISEILRMEKGNRAIFLVGSLLPDLLNKLEYPLSYLIGWQNASNITAATHIPFTVLMLCFLAALFFENSYAKTLLLLIAGSLAHFLLDMLMWPWPEGVGGVMWFWPLSWQGFKFGILWPESILPDIAVIAIIILLLLVKNRNKLFGKRASLLTS